jgi:hypothetical protein
VAHPRGPEDRKPRDAPAFPEPGGTRWELPVTLAGATGTLVIRTFDLPRRARTGLAFDTFDTEMSARGRAVLLLDAERRNRR